MDYKGYYITAFNIYSTSGIEHQPVWGVETAGVLLAQRCPDNEASDHFEKQNYRYSHRNIVRKHIYSSVRTKHTN